MKLEDTLYHKLLRVGMVVTALVLLFDGGFVVTDTARLSQNTQLYLANAVSVSVGIAPNELNQLTAQVTERNRELDVREAAIVEREIALEQNPVLGPSTNTSTFILSLILFILLVLIILNYGLDYARARKAVEYAARA